MSEPTVSTGTYRRDALLVAVSRMAPLAVQLVATPFVLGRLGSAAYAVWALMMTTINLLLTADLGVVGIMQRYHGVARGRGDRAFGGRVTASVIAVLLTLLVVVTAAGPWISRLVLALVEVPDAVHADAALLFRHAGTIAVLQLLALAFSSYLAAHDRFVAVAVQSLTARAVLVGGIAVALVGGSGLPGLLIASYADAAVAVLLGAVLCRGHLALDVRRPTDRAESRDLWSYAWRNQASALGFVAQRELDVIMAGILLPTAALASVAASVPLTAAVCLAPTVLLTPLFTSLSVQAGEDPSGLAGAAVRAERTWLSMVVPFGALCLGVLPFAAAAWLGPDVLQIVPLTAVLAVGFWLSLLGSVRAILVRAAGRPGIETRSYVVFAVVKVVLGTVLALVGGMLWLAASGALASLASLVVLRRGSSAITGPHSGLGTSRTWVLSGALLVVAGAASWLLSTQLEGRVLTLAALAAVAGAGGGVVLLLQRRGTGSPSAER